MHSLQPSCLPPKGATRMHLQVSAQHDTIYYHQMGNEMILGSSQPEIWLINLQGASWVVSGSSHSSCRAYPNMRIRYQSFWKHTCKPNCVCLASRFLAKRLKWFFSVRWILQATWGKLSDLSSGPMVASQAGPWLDPAGSSCGGGRLD